MDDTHGDEDDGVDELVFLPSWNVRFLALRRNVDDDCKEDNDAPEVVEDEEEGTRT